MADSDKKLYLLDAFALIYRAYFAFIKRPMINSKGVNTSAMIGFTNTLWELLRNEKPTHLAVVFDLAGPTTRASEYDFYKANRDETPADILNMIEPIKRLVEAFNLPCLGVEGYEADDVIGTLAKMAEKKGYTTYMVTPDKDFGQLVSENIFMYKPAVGRNPKQILGVPEVLEKWDIERVDQVIDMLGLMGDAVDNIPGIRGVGEKTACKFLKQYGSVEGLLEHAEEIKGKIGEKVRAGKEDALVSKHLATIILDAPIEWDEKALRVEEPNKQALTEIFDEYEFRTLGKRILGEDYNFGSTEGASIGGEQMSLFGGGNGNDEAASSSLKTLSDMETDYTLITKEEEMKSLAEEIMKRELVCFDTETSGLDPNLAELVGLSFSWTKGKAYYVAIDAERSKAEAQLDIFRPFFESDKVGKLGHNLKYDMLILKWYGIEVNGHLEDSMIAHYLIQPGKRHGMDYLAESFLAYSPVSIETLIGKKGKNQKSMRDLEPEQVSDYAAEDADITLQLHELFKEPLEKREVKKLYTEVEAPLVKVLTDMEFEGINLDVGFLETYSSELEKDALSTRDKIFEQAGAEFNLNSPRQLGDILFDKLGIPYKGKKTKTGQYSTSEDVLSKLAKEHPIANDIMEYRELTKLRSTYVEALPKLVNPKSGRIHTSFRQAIVPTGRLSSDNPNIQNIPIRTERGRKIRKAFIPANDEFVLLAADYSQVELRIIASLSDDEGMIEAFLNGEDIHSSTASKVFGVPLAEVDREMRRKAKAVNFGLAYGQGAFGLADNLGIKRGEAKEIIDNYFEKYPGIKSYMSMAVESAKEKGYTETIMGRKRDLPDINSGNHTVRSGAERNAVNTPIQGSAADIIKVAMIDIHNWLKREKFKSRMLLQVHDELVFDIHKDELDRIKPVIEEKMSGAVELKVPLLVESGVGQNWLEAH